MADREKIMAKCRKCIDTGEAEEDYQFYYDVIALLKEQDERIKMLEYQLETITIWRANAGAFD